MKGLPSSIVIPARCEAASPEPKNTDRAARRAATRVSPEIAVFMGSGLAPVGAPRNDKWGRK